MKDPCDSLETSDVEFCTDGFTVGFVGWPVDFLAEFGAVPGAWDGVSVVIFEGVCGAGRAA